MVQVGVSGRGRLALHTWGNEGGRCLDRAERTHQTGDKQAIEQVAGRRCRSIESFNDRKTTTHQLVLRVLHQTRENIRAGVINPGRRRLFSWDISSPGRA